MGSGGADNVTLRLLENFDRTKYEVSVALMKSQGELFGHVPSDVNIVNLNKSSLYFTVIPLIKLIDSKAYDVVYATSSGMSIPVLLARWISQRSEILTVVSERSSLERRRASSFKDKVIFKLKAWLTRKADHVVVVSDAIRAEVIKYTGVTKSKVVRAYNPIVPSNLSKLMAEPVDDKTLSSANPKIMTIGRLEPVKNIDLLIKAFAKLQNNKVELHILGVGTQREKLVQLVAELKIVERVFFHGFQNNVFKYLNKANLYVLPSKFEGMPGALIQAMACGKPCIASDCYTGPSELINHDMNGLLFPVGDIKTLTSQMQDLLGDAEKASRLGNQAKLSVPDYNYDAAIQSYFSFL